MLGRVLALAAGACALPFLPTLTGMQGVDDDGMSHAAFFYPDGFKTLTARYANQQKLLSPGLRRYNFFWASLESGPPPSATPQACPPNFLAVPANETDRAARGYNLYHCYSAKQLAPFDELLARDAEIGASSAFIMYGSPSFAADPACTGFPWPPNANYRMGCLPWGALDAYEDFVLFAVERWHAPWGSGLPRLSGLCIWNEIQSMGWSDPSPILPNRFAGAAPGAPMFTPPQMALYADMMVNLTLLAGRAAARASPAAPAFLWLSTDHFLTAPPLAKGDVGHVGLRPLLDAMWPALWARGSSAGINWGIAVHPYDAGDPRQDLSARGIYTFATLNKTVAAYQCEKLVAVGGLAPAQCWERPEVQLWASEQGWPIGPTMNKTLQARNICLAHGLSLAQGVYAVTHNLFQSAQPSSQGGSGDFSLVDEPPVVAADLANGPGHETFDAYVATGPAQWGRTSTHYCCTRWAQGCARAQ